MTTAIRTAEATNAVMLQLYLHTQFVETPTCCDLSWSSSGSCWTMIKHVCVCVCVYIYIYIHIHTHTHGWNMKYIKTDLYRVVRHWQPVPFTLIWRHSSAPRTAPSTHFTKHRNTGSLGTTTTDGQASVNNRNRQTSRHADDVNLLVLRFWRPSIKCNYQLSKKNANVAADVWEKHMDCRGQAVARPVATA